MICGRKLFVNELGIGKVLRIDGRISFLGDVNPRDGRLIDGRLLKDRIIIAKGSRGSTVGAYVIYALRYYDKAPKAIIFEEQSEPIVLTGCVMAKITHGDNFGKLDVPDGALINIEVVNGKLCIIPKRTPP